MREDVEIGATAEPLHQQSRESFFHSRVSLHFPISYIYLNYSIVSFPQHLSIGLEDIWRKKDTFFLWIFPIQNPNQD